MREHIKVMADAIQYMTSSSAWGFWSLLTLSAIRWLSIGYLVGVGLKLSGATQ